MYEVCMEVDNFVLFFANAWVAWIISNVNVFVDVNKMVIKSRDAMTFSTTTYRITVTSTESTALGYIFILPTLT